MKKIFNFGETVEGYDIPVLNEREIRAASGILFLGMFLSILVVVLKQDFTMLKYFVILFLSDFIIRVFINPKFSPSLILGRLIVFNQTPEYVGAKQKKFAWSIGFALGSLMFLLLIVLNSYSIITGLLCLICLIFLFFETSFGICLGCIFYGWIYKDKAQYCPGEICEVKDRHPIQKTNFIQLLIVVVFITLFVLSVPMLKESFSVAPSDLWVILGDLFSK